jgi:hypothetical protein
MRTADQQPRHWTLGHAGGVLFAFWNAAPSTAFAAGEFSSICNHRISTPMRPPQSARRLAHSRTLRAIRGALVARGRNVNPEHRSRSQDGERASSPREVGPFAVGPAPVQRHTPRGEPAATWTKGQRTKAATPWFVGSFCGQGRPPSNHQTDFGVRVNSNRRDSAMDPSFGKSLFENSTAAPRGGTRPTGNGRIWFRL